MRTHKIFPLLLVLGLLVTLGVGCRNSSRSVASLPEVPLEYWTVWDEPGDYNAIIAAYEAKHPNVHLTVRKIPFENFRQELVDAWAQGAGPDLFSMPNNAVGSFAEFSTPLPAALTLPALTVSTGCRKETRIVDQTVTTPVPEKLDEAFLPVVADDVLRNNQIYALPMAADTLGLYYNKDLLNAAKIVAPPKTWSEFADLVDASKSTLTREENGTLLQSGAALGTADNINRAADILAALMLQSGAQMTDASGTRVTFQQASGTEEGYNPGLSALQFYTAFANPGLVSYSWNETQPEAQEAFAAGKVAFFIGYSYQLDAIRRQNPALNVGIAPLPQISLDGPQTNFANYWVTGVAKQSAHPHEAWDFVLFATNGEQTPSYLNATKRLTALRQYIPGQKQELDLGVFADQLLIAKSWYHGLDAAATEEAMLQMIRDVHTGVPAEQALQTAAQKVQQTLPKTR